MEAWMGEAQPLQFGDLLGLFQGPQGHLNQPLKLVAGLSCSWGALKWAFQIPKELEGDSSMFMTAKEGLGSLFRPQDCHLVSVQY